MLQDQCISVTDLRTKTKECLDDLQEDPKYIFINNKPIAVLVSISEYEDLIMQPDLVELSNDEVDEKLLRRAEKARKTPKAQLINIK